LASWAIGVPHLNMVLSCRPMQGCAFQFILPLISALFPKAVKWFPHGYWKKRMERSLLLVGIALTLAPLELRSRKTANPIVAAWCKAVHPLESMLSTLALLSMMAFRAKVLSLTWVKTAYGWVPHQYTDLMIYFVPQFTKCFKSFTLPRLLRHSILQDTLTNLSLPTSKGL